MAEAAAAAGRAAGLEHDVAELGPAPGRAAVRLAVEDQPAADAGPERQHHDVSRSPRGARPAIPRSPRRWRRCRAPPAGRARSRIRSRRSTPSSGMFTDLSARPAAGRSARERRSRAPALPGSARCSSSTSESSSASSASCEEWSLGRSSRAPSEPSRETTAARIFVPPTSTPMTRDCSKTARVPYAAGCRRPAERSPTASTGAGARRAGCRPSGGPRNRRRGRRQSATAAATTAGPGRRRPPAARARSAGAAS